MPKTKLAVSLETRLVKEVDTLVKRRKYRSRSAAIEAALRNQVKAVRDEAYDEIVSQLDPAEERAWANDRYKADVF